MNMSESSSSEAELPQTFIEVTQVLVGDSPSAYTFLQCYVEHHEHKLIPTNKEFYFNIFKKD